MLNAYFDESEDQKAGVFSLVGWVSVPSAWDDFSLAWQDMLDKAPYPIRRGFHMKDIAHKTGEFANWSDAERTALVTKAVDLVVDTKLHANTYAIGCTVVSPEILKPGTSSYELYQLCFEAVFRELFDVFPIQNGINVLFDEKEKVRKDVNAHFYAVKDILDEAYPGKLDGCGFAKDEHWPPLQAADFIAYELRKRTCDRVAGKNNVRRSYQRMRDGRPHRFRCIDGRLLETIKQKGSQFTFRDIALED